jgi:hypothetical protein
MFVGSVGLRATATEDHRSASDTGGGGLTIPPRRRMGSVGRWPLATRSPRSRWRLPRRRRLARRCRGLHAGPPGLAARAPQGVAAPRGRRGPGEHEGWKQDGARRAGGDPCRPAPRARARRPWRAWTLVASSSAPSAGGAAGRRSWPAHDSYLVDSASSHMLVSKIKPCMSKYKQLYSETANGSLYKLSFI